MTFKLAWQGRWYLASLLALCCLRIGDFEGLPTLGFLGVILAISLILIAIHRFRSGEPREAIATFVATICIYLCTPVVYLHALLLPRLERTRVVVTRALQSQLPESVEFDYRVLVDRGTPQRIAISRGGILDNWTAYVYDPTGLVLKSREYKSWSNMKEPRFKDVRELFGGDLLWAEPLGQDWFLVGFT
ncbi:MAG: hypothetical protein ABL949_05495 [Fimbriimonadaceae bacterium]